MTAWQQVYQDALRIDSEAQGTVCTAQEHYRRGRHPQPYRIGIVHNYKQADEHWHSGEKEARKCSADPFSGGRP